MKRKGIKPVSRREIKLRHVQKWKDGHYSFYSVTRTRRQLQQKASCSVFPPHFKLAKQGIKYSRERSLNVFYVGTSLRRLKKGRVTVRALQARSKQGGQPSTLASPPQLTRTGEGQNGKANDKFMRAEGEKEECFAVAASNLEAQAQPPEIARPRQQSPVRRRSQGLLKVFGAALSFVKRVVSS
mmetsp:Transcript_3431/g.6773  ORF Transcript_3431/g.6773 Transcript_3431/m.6773 type:complete len:184 (-) Transcript_3431:731-1282(-)